MTEKTAIVVGFSGVIGSALLKHLETLGHWEPVALTRRAAECNSRTQFIQVDLADPGAC